MLGERVGSDGRLCQPERRPDHRDLDLRGEDRREGGPQGGAQGGPQGGAQGGGSGGEEGNDNVLDF